MSTVMRESTVRTTTGERSPPARRNLTAILRDWHKRAGLAAFLFLGWLGLSGIFLNEASDLGLNGIRVSWPWLMAVYGLHAAPPQNGFASSSHWIATTGHGTTLDGKLLSSSINGPVGMVSAPDSSGHDTIYVATSSSIVMLDNKGGRVDELRDPPLPVTSVRAIGLIDKVGALAVRDDSSAFQSADGGETWTPVAPDKVHWSSLDPLSANQQAKLLPLSRPSVAVQQILVDAHSGRLFGRSGTYVIDVVGLLALLLATSGVWMMWRTSSRKRQAGRPTLTKTP